jgi:hypothetical protein
MSVSNEFIPPIICSLAYYKMSVLGDYKYHAGINGLAAFISLFVAQLIYVGYGGGSDANSLTLAKAIAAKTSGQAIPNPISVQFLIILAITMFVVVYLVTFGNNIALTDDTCGNPSPSAAAKWAWIPPVSGLASVALVYNIPTLREPVINIVHKLGRLVMRIFGEKNYSMSLFTLESFAYGYYAFLGAGVGVAISYGLVKSSGCKLSEEQKVEALRKV